jgi:hypothetical protein
VLQAESKTPEPITTPDLRRNFLLSIVFGIYVEKNEKRG